VKMRRALLTVAGGAAAALIAASPALAAGTWQVDSSPNPAGSTFSELNAVFAASHTEAFAVGQTRVAASGDGFETLIEEWNGSTWSVVPGAPASVSASSLNGVSGTGPGDIWAVGQNSGTSFIEHWNGQSWSQVASPASGGLNAVSADSPTDAWAGGSAIKVSDSGVTPLIEHWNGTQWSVTPFPKFDTTEAVNIISIAAISPADAWAVTEVNKANPAVVEHWNGSKWSTVSVPFSVNALSAASANDVWAVGGDGHILHWNGTQWSQVANPNGQGAGGQGAGGQGADLAAVAALSANDAWAISEKGSVTEQWNGTQWTAVPPASALPDDFRVSGGFIWSGGSLSGLTGGPLFAVGNTDNDTTILQQPQP